MPPPYGAPQPGGLIPPLAAPVAVAPGSAPTPPLLASTRLLKRLLLVALCVSLVSAGSFIAYLVIPHAVSSQRHHHIHALFLAGLIGLAAAMTCQFVGVFVLLWQWAARERTWRKFGEFWVLLISLVPYVIIGVFLVTLIIYLRARSKDPLSKDTREAKEDLKDKTTDMIVDEVASRSKSAATAVAQQAPMGARSIAPGARPPRMTMREAVGRVVGPSTQRSLSDAGGGLAGVTMVAVVLATIATLGALSPLSRVASATTLARATATAQATATPPASQITEFKVTNQLGASRLSGSITTGPDGALWFTDEGAGAIGRMTVSGQMTEYTTPTRTSEPGAMTLGSETNGITTGSDGNLWFTEDNNGAGQIGRCTPQGVITEFPVSGSGPTSITNGPDGNLWFTDYGFNNAIGVMTPTGSVKEYPIPTAYAGPGSIVAGPDGALWFLEGAKVGRVTTSGVFTEYPVPQGSPSQLTTGPDGNLWITLNGSPDKIARVTPTGVITIFPLTANGVIGGITSGPDGNLWFTEAQAGKIGRITPAGAVLPELSVPSSMSLPLGITAGPDGKLWFTETNVDPVIGRITPS